MGNNYIRGVYGKVEIRDRPSSREDIVGMTIFSVVVILSLIFMVGHIIEWGKAGSNGKKAS
ncbi:MAG: hypothetical protein DRO99_00710 [Candidatus Aenigmatarchaeota archaeon]|nr:MAG: hypothetical protein DRO99_00710 [Candidatus Aenigmarchaeota archaeon]